MMRTIALSTSLLLLVLCPKVALAWERPRYEDATVVERSELIVVAHLKEGSIEKVSHAQSPTEGASWEHHAVLVISTVLKGKCDKQEISLIIHYGLLPLAGEGRKDSPKKDIRIVDDGGSKASDIPVKNAGEDNLWFLRKRSGIYGREPGTGDYGIVDPEDLQPLELKAYFLLYLSDNPEAAVKETIRKSPKMAERGKRYLDHLEVQRILKMEDPEKRYDALLPFFLNRTTWDMKQEASAGIAACGPTAGERLKDVFTDPMHHNLRSQIIWLWRKMNYRPIAPLLIDLLIHHDKFWADQDLKKGWWSDRSDPQLTMRRQDIYGEVYDAVYTLRSFGDPKAKDALEMTRKRWIAVDFDNKQIVEECEAALRELAAMEKPAQPGAPADADKPRR
jgi:hypothetical protein